MEPPLYDESIPLQSESEFQSETRRNPQFIDGNPVPGNLRISHLDNRTQTTIIDLNPTPPSSSERVELEMIQIPPAYSPSAAPPPYLAKSQYLPTTRLHKISQAFVNLDLIFNMALVAFILILYSTNSNGSSPAEYLIPLIYMTISLFGFITFKKKRAKYMLLYCGAFFARWCGDMAVLIYVSVNDLYYYFDMSVFTVLFSMPMLGIRGFYPDLFPCYNDNIIISGSQNCSTSKSDAAVVNAAAIFGSILFFQLMVACIITYDALYLIQIDEPAEFGSSPSELTLS